MTMSGRTTTGPGTRTADYYCMDESDAWVRDRGWRTSGGALAERWQHVDEVVAIIDALVHAGRGREAAAIERVLGHDDDEAAMRAYVSRLWADDWNSPEDSVYDQL